MPVSKKRKKKGKVVRSKRRWTDAEIAEMNRPAGVSLQDLINVVAAQEFQKDPDAYKEAHPVVDEQQEEPEDGRQGSSSAGAPVQRGEEERGES